MHHRILNKLPGRPSAMPSIGGVGRGILVQITLALDTRSMPISMTN